MIHEWEPEMLVEIRERYNVNLPRVNSQGEVNMRVKESVSEERLGGQVWRPAPLMVEFRKMLLPMPLLFLSGIFTGVGIMLALK